MNFLRKFWPLSFREKPAVKNLVITAVIYAVAPTILSIVLGCLGQIPGMYLPMAILSWVVATPLGLYCTAGIAFTFLNYFKVGPFA